MSQYLPQATAPFHSAADRHAKRLVLSVSPIQEDHHALDRLLRGENWLIHKVSNVTAAVDVLRHIGIPVVVCHSDSIPDSWKAFMEIIAELPGPPPVIVASRLADEHLWAEALNLGAYDVLAKPLVATEVIGVFTSAWLRWRNEHEVAVNSSKRMAAGASA